MLSFNNAVDIANYDDAYTSLTQLTNFETYILMSFDLIVVNGLPSRC